LATRQPDGRGPENVFRLKQERRLKRPRTLTASRLESRERRPLSPVNPPFAPSLEDDQRKRVEHAHGFTATLIGP